LLKQISRLQQVREQVDSIKGAKLRALASNYTTEYLQCVGALLAGTVEGNTVVNGETLEEEVEKTSKQNNKQNNKQTKHKTIFLQMYEC
jgi:hypothetical protein